MNKSILPVLPKLKLEKQESPESLSMTLVEDKELRKKLRNRQSALAARERKKARMQELEKQVVTLQESMKCLKSENQNLRSRLDMITKRCQDAGVSLKTEKDFFICPPNSADNQFNFFPGNLPNSSCSYHNTTEHSSNINDRVGQFCSSSSQEGYLYNRIPNAANLSSHYSCYSNPDSAKSCTDTQKQDQSLTNAFSECHFTKSIQSSNCAPFFQHTAQTPLQIPQNQLKQEDMDFQGYVNPINLVSPPYHTRNRFHTETNQRSEKSTCAGPIKNKAQSSKATLENNPSSLLPSINAMLEQNQKAEGKCPLQSDFRMTNNFHPNCDLALPRNRNHPYSKCDGAPSVFKKSKSFHSLVGLTVGAGERERPKHQDPRLQSSNCANRISNGTTSSNKAISQVSSPVPELGFPNPFPDIASSSTVFDGTSSLLDLVVNYEESNEITSSRSDSGISIDDHLEWPTDSVKLSF